MSLRAQPYLVFVRVFFIFLRFSKCMFQLVPPLRFFLIMSNKLHCPLILGPVKIIMVGYLLFRRSILYYNSHMQCYLHLVLTLPSLLDFSSNGPLMILNFHVYLVHKELYAFPFTFYLQEWALNPNKADFFPRNIAG